jgi:hypothetical protein
MASLISIVTSKEVYDFSTTRFTPDGGSRRNGGALKTKLGLALTFTKMANTTGGFVVNLVLTFRIIAVSSAADVVLNIISPVVELTLKSGAS